jgi:DnaJ like chaperone protein
MPGPYHHSGGEARQVNVAIWGKLLGVAAGLAVGGPLGALLGGVAGHVFDRWRKELLLEGPALGDEPILDPMETRRIAFATAVIVLAAKLAKADGAVSRTEIDTFKDVFDVRDEDVGGIARIFDEAKRSPDGFEPYARQIAAMFAYEPEILEELLDQLFMLAAADGALNPAEIAWLAEVAKIFGFSGPAFDSILVRYGASRRPSPPAVEPDAYTLLGLQRGASDAEVKAAWRKLVREHHPDRLVAQGVPEEMLKRANGRLAAINAAYDRIARERGLN